MVVILDLDLQRELNFNGFVYFLNKLKLDFKNNKISKRIFLLESDLLIDKFVRDCEDLDREKKAREDREKRKLKEGK